ncbi:MAG TPA: flagellar hook-length control protein FliK, partial [Janthinobacterium sp.]|nr:flagellar hook-length control protein FliK [Janthinobacterium sp.]
RAAAAAEADLARGDSLSGAADAAANPAQGGATAARNARPLSPAAILLSKAPLTPSGDLPAFDPSAPAPALSDAARAIATVLTQAESRPGAPQALSGKTPLLDPARADTAQLAQTLQDTVVSSGLFYESHVAEWAQGKRALPDLQREPQMQKAMDNGDAASAARAAPAAATDLASAQLINLQLHTQEQSRVVWQGEAWPGQKMEWDIGRGGPEQGPGGKRGGAGSQEHTAWRSGVRFQFPTLGEVSASVVLIGGQVHIQMQAAAPDTAAALRAHAAALGASLDAAGSPLSSFSVGQPETTVAAGPAGQAGAAHGD